uniref:Acidic L10PO ribosomal protein n=1 Tax=Sterkiella nova TaxID=200597 RepID=J9VCU7_STENO|nr:acidic L10PO ribosomal protein [Sterkiella nova]
MIFDQQIGQNDGWVATVNIYANIQQLKYLLQKVRTRKQVCIYNQIILLCLSTVLTYYIVGGLKKKSEKRIKKEEYWHKLQDLAGEYSKAILVDVDNVSSNQINQIRLKLRPLKAKMVMGKNGNTGIIFSNGDLSEIQEAPAKVGAVAPDDVWIRAGSTGLDPKQTSFFQQLNIQTKIVKTQIDIVADKKIITSGMKIEATHAALLDKLKIRPFSYKMNVKKVYEDGSIFNPDVLDITSEDILKRFRTTISNMASISLASGFIIKPAVPHLLANAFKNLAAVTFDTDYSFKQADKMKEAAKNAVHVAPTAAATTTAAPAKVEEKKEEEPADVDMGGLFGDDY